MCQSGVQWGLGVRSSGAREGRAPASARGQYSSRGAAARRRDSREIREVVPRNLQELRPDKLLSHTEAIRGPEEVVLGPLQTARTRSR